MQVGVGDGNVLPNMFQSDIFHQNERRVVVLVVFDQVETEDIGTAKWVEAALIWRKQFGARVLEQ